MTLINGILLLYNYPFEQNANTIMEHVNAFKKNSQFKVWAINIYLGLPKQLQNFQFTIIVFHYSIPPPYHLHKQFEAYINNSKESYKVAFFQDEFHNCPERFDFINRFNINCIYTLLEPQYFKDIYQKYTTATKMVSTIPGFVSDELIKSAQQFTLPDNLRTIDIGYRGRRLPYFMGRGGQEKSEIGEIFLLKVKNMDLRLDIETQECTRIYGDDWYRFIANCKGVLGVEAGVSIFDIDGSITREYKEFLIKNNFLKYLELESSMSFEEFSKQFNFDRYESKMFHRVISPRIFEAAAFRVCQILYEGKYSGIMKPMVHYIPLKKDFSNFEEVMRLFNDPIVRHQLTENAYNDLIASGKYSYKKFIEQFDEILINERETSEIDEKTVEMVTISIKSGEKRRYLFTKTKDIMETVMKWLFHLLPLKIQAPIKKAYTDFRKTILNSPI